MLLVFVLFFFFHSNFVCLILFFFLLKTLAKLSITFDVDLWSLVVQIQTLLVYQYKLRVLFLSYFRRFNKLVLNTLLISWRVNKENVLPYFCLWHNSIFEWFPLYYQKLVAHRQSLPVERYISARHWYVFLGGLVGLYVRSVEYLEGLFFFIILICLLSNLEKFIFCPYAFDFKRTNSTVFLFDK